MARKTRGEREWERRQKDAEFCARRRWPDRLHSPWSACCSRSAEAIKALNFTMPTDQHFGQEVKEKLLLPAVKPEETVDLLGVAPFTPVFTPDDGVFG
jgi:hypothetical protein